jgi:lipopolysaccharide cholinephosphotransferase
VKQKEQGCWIDIFKYYDIPSAKSKKIVDYFYRRAYREIHHYGDVTYNSKIKITLNKVIAYLIYPISALAVDFLGVFARLIKSNLYGRYSTTDHTYKKEHIFPLVEIEYEGHLFYAPKDYDAHLKRIYGNYMDIPPVEKREQLLDVEKIEFYE